MLWWTWIYNWKLSSRVGGAVTISKLAVKKCGNWRKNKLEALVRSHHYVNCFLLLLLHPEVRRTQIGEGACPDLSGRARVLRRTDRSTSHHPVTTHRREARNRDTSRSWSLWKDVSYHPRLKHVQHGQAPGRHHPRRFRTFQKYLLPSSQLTPSLRLSCHAWPDIKAKWCAHDLN